MISKETLEKVLKKNKKDKKTIRAVAVVAMNQNIRKPKKGRLKIL